MTAKFNNPPVCVLYDVIYDVKRHSLILGENKRVCYVTSVRENCFYFQNPFKVFTSMEQWVFTGVCMLYLAYGILSLTEAGSLAF